MFAFVIGTGRCGSTLVHELLARHPDVGFVSNLEDRVLGLPAGAGRFNNSLYRRMPARLLPKSFRYGPSEAYRVLSREVSPMLAASSRDLVASDATPWVARRFRAFFMQRSRAQGKPVFLHKFTGWPRTGFIREVFSDARFIHVVRDGRSFVASALRTPWFRGYLGPENWQWGPMPAAYTAEWEASGRSFVLLAGLSWKIMLDAYDAARALVPAEQWLDVRFEDVVADPRARFGEMLEFMGLGGIDAIAPALAATAFSTERQEVFQRELGTANVAMLEASLAHHLNRWGYC
jgi:hypothetical protein